MDLEQIDGIIVDSAIKVHTVLPVHKAQLLSYLKLSKCKLGFLFNFNVVHMKDGIRGLVNGF